MNMQEFKIFKDQNNSNLKFDFSLKNLNWMNIGGSAKVFFKPENLKELISFLKIVPKYKKHVLGAGSNLLISEKLGEKIWDHFWVAILGVAEPSINDRVFAPLEH